MFHYYRYILYNDFKRKDNRFWYQNKKISMKLFPEKKALRFR